MKINPLALVFFCSYFIFNLSGFCQENSINSLLSSKNKLDETISYLAKDIKSRQLPDGHWDSANEVDTSYDAKFFLLGHALGKVDESLRLEIINRLINYPYRSKENGGWLLTPHHKKPDHSITGLNLYTLERAGIERHHPAVRATWRWFISNGGLEKVNLFILKDFYLFDLGPENIVDDLMLLSTPLMFVLPKEFIFSIRNYGIFESYYMGLIINHYLKEGYDINKIDYFYKFKKKNICSFEFMNHFGIAFINSRLIGEGISCILSFQEKEGGFYSPEHAFVALLAINKLHKTGRFDFSRRINLGWNSLLNARRFNSKGRKVFTLNSTNWDTALLLITLTNSGYIDDDGVENIINYLLEKEIRRGYAVGGWSFTQTNHSYIDVDTTAIVIRALLKASMFTGKMNKKIKKVIFRAVEYLLRMQDPKTGGFYVWFNDAKNFENINYFLKDFPTIPDKMAPALTARAIASLSLVTRINHPQMKRIEKAIFNGCQYLLLSPEKVKNVPVKLWSGEWYFNYIFSTSQILALGLECGCFNYPSTAIEAYRKWFLSIQNMDGGWGEDVNQPEGVFLKGKSSVNTTNFVLLFFLEIIRQSLFKNDFSIFEDNEFMNAINKAVGYVIKYFQTDTSKKIAFQGVLTKKPYSFINYEILPQIGSLKILTEYRKILEIMNPYKYPLKL